MFIPKGKDPIVAGIEEKITTWTFLPKENGEDIQVLRYEPGQKYDPHYDYFTDKVNIARGGHRVNNHGYPPELLTLLNILQLLQGRESFLSIEHLLAHG